MSNKRYWQKTKGTKNFMKIVWKRLEVMIRFATEEDAEELLRIYSYYVENTAITFEYDTPALDEFKYRIRTIKAMYPYLVSEVDGKIVGYAYANTFKDRAAYDWAVEVTVYVKMGFSGHGAGTLLYTELERCLSMQNIINLNACITYPNEKSEAFHRKLGYKTVAHFTKCGYKSGAWKDMIWMEKIIGQHRAGQANIVPFTDVKMDFT